MFIVNLSFGVKVNLKKILHAWKWVIPLRNISKLIMRCSIWLYVVKFNSCLLWLFIILWMLFYCPVIYRYHGFDEICMRTCNAIDQDSFNTTSGPECGRPARGAYLTCSNVIFTTNVILHDHCMRLIRYLFDKPCNSGIIKGGATVIS